MTLTILAPITSRRISVTVPAKRRQEYRREEARRWVLRELDRIEQQRWTSTKEASIPVLVPNSDGRFSSCYLLRDVNRMGLYPAAACSTCTLQK
jgi:hypothetical protein